MNGKLILLTFITLLLTGGDKRRFDYDQVVNRSFHSGEVLKYRVHYGFVNAAEGEMFISDEIHRVNGRDCFKIDVFGKSVGMFDLFLRIRDNWGTYLDTTSMVPQKFYRTIEEGKYRKREIIKFDHTNLKARVTSFDKKKKVWKPEKIYDVPTNVQDMVSGYYFLRTMDFKKLQPGDIINIDAFFEDQLYDFNIKFVGREKVKTKLGKINSLVLSPIMPENSLFDGENSIRVWISDDINKVPLKIKAEMFVGSVEIDIVSFKKGIK